MANTTARLYIRSATGYSRGNISEPRAPVRLRCASFSVERCWQRAGRARPDGERFFP
jgi:hypothetical protein